MIADGDEVSKEARIDVAYGAVKQLLLAIHLGGDDLPDPFREFIDKAVRITLAQHGEHLVCHCVKQTHADPYKLVSWLGCAILSQIPCETGKSSDEISGFRIVSNALIKTLCGLLKYDTEGKVELPSRARKLLRKMLKEEKIGNRDHGIWQNGLYAAFHCAITSYRVFDGQIQPDVSEDVSAAGLS